MSPSYPFISITDSKVDTTNVDDLFDFLMVEELIDKVSNTINGVYIKEGFIVDVDLLYDHLELDHKYDLRPMLMKLFHKNVYPYGENFIVFGAKPEEEISKYMANPKSWLTFPAGTLIHKTEEISVSEEEFNTISLAGYFRGMKVTGTKTEGGYKKKYTVSCSTSYPSDRPLTLLDVSDCGIYNYMEDFLDDDWFKEKVKDGLYHCKSGDAIAISYN